MEPLAYKRFLELKNPDEQDALANRERLRRFQSMGVYLQFGEMERFLENMIAAQFLPHTDARLYPSVHPRKRAL